jgi:hypothetical protein
MSDLCNYINECKSMHAHLCDFWQAPNTVK